MLQGNALPPIKLQMLLGEGAHPGKAERRGLIDNDSTEGHAQSSHSTSGHLFEVLQKERTGPPFQAGCSVEFIAAAGASAIPHPLPVIAGFPGPAPLYFVRTGSKGFCAFMTINTASHALGPAATSGPARVVRSVG